jgi:hypothetical protein
MGEVAAEVAVDPELGVGEVSGTVVSFVDFVGVVELAEVRGLAVFVMRCGMRVEIARANMRAAAGFDGGGVDGPVVGGGRSGVSDADGEQSENYK